MGTDWWAEIEDPILECLRDGGAMSPADLARRLGISPREATAFVCMLATEGKVRLRLFELAEEEPPPPEPLPSRREDLVSVR